jgi:hypothetical protein
MGKKEQQSPFAGRWRILSIEQWDVDYMEEEGPAFIEFGAEQMGEFRFGLTSGNIDYRITERGEQLATEWTWAWTRWTPAQAGAGPFWRMMNCMA